MKYTYDFSKIIAKRTQNFSGRQWLFKTVDKWLTNPRDSQFLLIIGNPGTGKTAIASRLSQFSTREEKSSDFKRLKKDFLSAIHFCSGDLNWRNPQVFTKSISLQLSERYAFFAKALLENLGEGRIEININQRNNITEQAAALIVKNLNINLSTEYSFSRLVWMPLKSLFQDDNSEEVIVLVDALDEALYYSGKINIVHLIANSQFPKKTRFIITTRNDQQILNMFTNPTVLKLDSSEFYSNYTDDISKYIKKRTSTEEKLRNQFRELNSGNKDKMVDTLIGKASGNFQYITFLLNAISEGRQKLEEISILPVGLDALYSDYLSKFIERYGDEWLTHYSPILGTLSVAQEDLTLNQLQLFTGQPKSELLNYLGRLQQFIERTKSTDNNIAHESKYRLYHQSFTDFFSRQFIMNEKTESDNAYYLPPEEWHRKIVDYYWQIGMSQQEYDCGKIDNYGLLHLTSHLYSIRDEKIDGIKTYLQKLYLLFNKSFMAQKLLRFGTPKSFSEDVDLALEAACSEEPPNLLQIIRLILIDANLGDFATGVPINTLLVLTLVGEKSKAFAYAALMDEEQRKEAYIAIGNALVELGESSSAVDAFKHVFTAYSKVLFEQVLKIVGYRKDQSLEKNLDLLSSLMPRGGMLTRIVEPVTDRSTKKWDEAESPFNVDDVLKFYAVQYFNKLGDFNQSRKIANKINGRITKANALASIAEALSEKGLLDDATAVADTIDGNALRTKVSTLCRIAQSYVNKNEKTEAKKITSELFQNTLAAENTIFISDKAYSLLFVAELSAVLGDNKRVIEIADRLQSIANSPPFCHFTDKSGKEDIKLDTISDRLILFSIAASVLSIERQKSRVLEIANYVFSEVDKELNSNMYSTSQDDILIPMLTALVKSGESDRALTEFIKIQERISQRSVGAADTILAELVSYMIDLGETKKAVRAAGLIRNKSSVLVKVSEKQINAGKFQKALEIAREIEAKSSLAYVLDLIATALRNKRKINNLQRISEELLSIAQNIENEPASILSKENPKATALGAAALIMTMVGNLPKAAELANKSLECAANKTISYEDTKVETLTAIAKSLVSVGEFEKGLDVATSSPISIWKARMLTAVVQSLVSLDLFNETSEPIRITETISRTEGNSWNTDILFEEAAVALTAAGEVNRAIDIFSKIKKVFRKLEALSRMMDSSTTVKEQSKADSILNLALESLPKKIDGYSKMMTLRVLESAMRRTSNIGDAKKLRYVIDLSNNFMRENNISDVNSWVDSEIEIPGNNTIKETLPELKSLNMLVMFQALVHLQSFDEALQIQDEIQDNNIKQLSHLIMVESNSEHGNFHNAIKIARSIENDWIKALALSEISEYMIMARNASTGSPILENAISIVRDKLSKVTEEDDGEDDEDADPEILMKIIGVMARLGKFDEAYSFASVFDDKSEAIANIANELTNQGQVSRAFSIWKDELIRIHLTEGKYKRADLLRALEYGAPFLSSINRGKILWDIYSGIVEVESWWGI